MAHPKSPGDGPTPRAPAPLFDRAAALAFLGGSLELLAEAGRETLVEVPRHLARLSRAVADRDHASAHRTAHTLKGTLGLMGGAQAADCADRLQQAASDGDRTTVERVFAELEALLARYLVELRAALDALPRDGRGPEAG